MTDTKADSLVVPLAKKVPAHGETIDTLTFREPLGSDIAKYGNPVKINFTVDPPDISFDEVKMTRMLSALASVPESTIGALTASDWNVCAWSITGFFLPAGTPSASATG
jgi:hypothetical protein